MLLKHYLSAICIGLTCLTQPIGLGLSAPRDNRMALSPSETQAQMAKFVVRIDGAENNGSGFIINKNGNRYTVLTNEHVVKNSNGQTITTPDGRKYFFSAKNIRTFPGIDIDLAEITFVSEEIYKVATLSANPVRLGDPVYVYGWNAIIPPIYPVRQGRFAMGIINQILPIDNSHLGFTLVFNLPAVSGLSGSPLLNANGEVIGIYGLTDKYDKSSTLGISIATYQRHASTARAIPVSPAPIPTVSNPPPILQPAKAANNNFSLAYSLSGHQDQVDSVAISPDGQTLVSGSDDKTIKVWRLRDGELLRTLSGHQDQVDSVAISPDGQTLVSGSGDKTIKVWRLRDGALLRTFVHQDRVGSIAISPDGQTIVSGSYISINVWRLRDGKLLTLSGHDYGVGSVAISPDGQTIVSGGFDHTIKVWRLRDGELLHTLSGHQGPVNSVAISPNGETIVTGGLGRNIKVWRLRDGELLRTLSGHQYAVGSVAISPDGQTIVTGCFDKIIQVWRVSP